MKLFRICVLAATMVVLGGWLNLPGLSPSAQAVTMSSERVLVGELVATNASRNQFRLVGHSGSFTAPSGTSVSALDGKPVQVELGSNGRVIQIVETPFHIDRVTDGYEIVSGEFVVRDPVLRSFSIAGDDRSFIAPVGFDVQPYAGRMVKVRVDGNGQVTNIEGQPGSPSAPFVSTCSYNGQGYSEGWSVCQSGMQYRCEGATWRNLGVACAGIASTRSCALNDMTFADGSTRCDRGMQYRCDAGTWRDLGIACAADVPTTYRSAPRSCAVGDASVADGSSICRRGMTFRCADGQWINTGAACSS